MGGSVRAPRDVFEKLASLPVVERDRDGLFPR